MPQTLANADAALQDNYVEPIVNSVADRSYIVDKVQRDAESIDATGRRAVWTIHSRRNRGRRTIVEGGTLPSAGAQGYDPATATIAYHTYSLEITDAAIEATTGKEHAFADLLTEETKGVALDMKQDISRQSYGDGTGLIASVTVGGTGVTTFTLDTVQYLEIGDPLDVIVRATGLSGGSTSLVDINYATKVITVSPAVPGVVDATFGVYVSGNRNQEMPGLKNIVHDSNTLHTIDRTQGKYAFFRSRVVDLAAAPAGESSFQQIKDSINTRGFGEVQEFLTTYGIRRRLAGTYTSTKRFNDAEAVKIQGGYTAIFVDEVPVLCDNYMSKGDAYALNSDALRWFEQTKPGWMQQKDGSIFNLKTGPVAGTYAATWQAFFRWYATLGAKKPALLGRLKNCADDVAESN